MKRISVFLLFASALLTLACTQVNTRYSVRGTDLEDGRKVYLLDMITNEPINSTVVSGGTFQMKGKAARDAYLAVNIDDDDWWFLFFNDGVPVQVDGAGRSLSGSALNNKLADCDKRNEAAYTEYSRLKKTFDALPLEERLARAEEFGAQDRAALRKYTDFLLGLIQENLDNLIPVAFIEDVPGLAGEECFNELLASGAPFTKHPYVTALKRRMD